MLLFRAGTEQEGVLRYQVEGFGCGEGFYTQACEEGFVESVEDGVLGVDWEGVWERVCVWWI